MVPLHLSFFTQIFLTPSPPVTPMYWGGGANERDCDRGRADFISFALVLSCVVRISFPPEVK